MVYQIVFMSNLVGDETRNDLNKILGKSESNNKRDGITGVLLYKNRQFFQVLEGNEREVKACFERISSNPRHRSIHTLWSKSAPKRSFPSWSTLSYRRFKMPCEFSGCSEKESIISNLLSQDIGALDCDATALKFACIMFKKFQFLPLVQKPQKTRKLCPIRVNMSRFDAAPSAHLSHLSLEGDRAFLSCSQPLGQEPA